MQWRSDFTPDQLKEIDLCRLYAQDFGHNPSLYAEKLIIAKLAAILDNVAAFESPLDDMKLLVYLHTLLAQEGTQGNLARRLGVSMSSLSLTLQGGKPPSDMLLKSLGLRRVVTYVADSVDVDINAMLRTDDVVISE